MTTYLVLTVIADDKPGLVESLSQVIADRNGNWLESSMSQLAGKFAGILRVSVEDQDADPLIGALEGLSPQLRLVIERVDGAATTEPAQTIELNLVGNDRPGIIREISHALAGLSVNVEQLSTQCTPAPMGAGVHCVLNCSTFTDRPARAWEISRMIPGRSLPTRLSSMVWAGSVVAAPSTLSITSRSCGESPSSAPIRGSASWSSTLTRKIPANFPASCDMLLSSQLPFLSAITWDSDSTRPGLSSAITVSTR